MRGFLNRLMGASLLLMLVPAGHVLADPGAEAQQVVRTVTDQVLDRLNKQSADFRGDPGKVYKLVNEIVVPHFDALAMSRWVLGKHWRKASKEQKLEFTRQFRTLLVRTYGTALANYTDEKVEYDAPRVDKTGKKVKVRTRIVQSGGPDIPIYYSLSNRNEAWRVYDVAIDGISMVANYRTTFSQRISKSGMDDLIKRLSARNDG